MPFDPFFETQQKISQVEKFSWVCGIWGKTNRYKSLRKTVAIKVTYWKSNNFTEDSGIVNANILNIPSPWDTYMKESYQN